MAAEEEKSDFYAVLGLQKECAPGEVREAYKKLALKWHPDRMFGSGSSTQNCVEEAKARFQAIQEAYSVIGDPDKRFLYDVGVYDCNDEDDHGGMADFLKEMTELMSNDRSNVNTPESFQELQQLLDEMLESEKAAKSTASSSTSSFAAPPSLSQRFCIGTSSTSRRNRKGGRR